MAEGRGYLGNLEKGPISLLMARKSPEIICVKKQK
jgi:hypothetical protein